MEDDDDDDDDKVGRGHKNTNTTFNLIHKKFQSNV
jgi:hypothetical protein